MAAAAEHAPGPPRPSAFLDALALLAREYEQLGAENRQLRARLGGEKAEPEGWGGEAPPRQGSGDWELEAPQPVRLREWIHGMAPPAFGLAVLPMPPAPGPLDSPLPSDACLTTSSHNSGNQCAAPGACANGRSMAPLVEWTLPGSTDKGADEDRNGRYLRAPAKLRKANTQGDMPGQGCIVQSQRTLSSVQSCTDASDKTSNPFDFFLQDTESPRKPVFANASDMKEKVRQSISKAPYVVSNFYKSEGMWQYIARQPAFENVTLIVIFLNAIWIAVDADYNTASVLNDADAIFQVVENIFCTYFSLELLVRFMAFQRKRDCFKDGWFCFDFVLVMLMIGETWIMSIAIMMMGTSLEVGGQHQLGNYTMLRLVRLVRLTRMARMARLLRAVPELMILVKGMVSAARCVSLMLLLLCVVLYIFAIAFQQLLQGTDAGRAYFDSVLSGMHTLWIKGALLDEVSEVVSALRQEGVFILLLLDVFILIAQVLLMNMLIGVLCEVVSAVAAAERENLAIMYAKSKLERIFNEVLDEDGNQSISKQEFVQIINNQEATRTMHDLDVDVVGLVDFADVIFAKDLNDDDYENELSFAQFMEIVVAFRGSNTATVKDIEMLRKFFAVALQRCENKMVRLEAVLTSVGCGGMDRASGMSPRRLSGGGTWHAVGTR